MLIIISHLKHIKRRIFGVLFAFEKKINNRMKSIETRLHEDGTCLYHHHHHPNVISKKSAFKLLKTLLKTFQF